MSTTNPSPLKCNHCGGILLFSEDRGPHCDGCEDFDPEHDLPRVYPTDLNELAAICHEANKKWWQDPVTGKPIARNKYELLGLIVSELSECLEGERKNLMDDKLPHRKMAEVELADAKIRILDYSAGFGLVIKPEPTWPKERCPDNKGHALYLIMRMVTNEFLDAALEGIECYARAHGYDIEGAFAEKMAFNAKREDHTHEARRISGGKKF